MWKLNVNLIGSFSSADLGSSSTYSSEFIFTLILSLEEEKGFIRTVFGYELVGPKMIDNSNLKHIDIKIFYFF